ncbi:MAG: hypothetical protein AUJ24_01060 [Parcubacteria group bacterium CG1_02_36_42]|nr:MAG: hypothetical protein AUJ24_01060 [Parcubacteria group bacterium CG1_02_36_42]
MFYQCQKCKRTWQYPLQKCPECFLKLERFESKNLKVIGISRVLIPSPMHPKVPYFVLLLEDENGNKFVQKFTPYRTGGSDAGAMKEYKIGDRFEIKASQNKNFVAIWRAKYDLYEAISRVISLLGGLKIDQNKKILILPTLVSVCHPHERENTHPEVLRELIKILIEKGAKAENIKVAGQSHSETPIEAMAKKSQILSVCSENKVEFLDLGKGIFKRIEKEGLVFEISEEIFKNDLIINLPILKLDSKLGVKGAMENLIRFWKKENFLGQKYLYGEEELILKLKEVFSSFAKASEDKPKILNLADGTIIQRSNRQAVILDLILASFNPLNLDRVFAEISMIPLPEYLKSVKISEIPISGREIGEVQWQLEKI